MKRVFYPLVDAYGISLCESGMKKAKPNLVQANMMTTQSQSMKRHTIISTTKMHPNQYFIKKITIYWQKILI